MRTILFNSKLLASFILTLPLMCSPEDDSENEVEMDFTPVTISLQNVNIEEEESTFMVDGFQFTLTNGSPNSSGADGIFVGALELDLEPINGFSTITIDMLSNSISTTISLLNNGNLIEENDNIAGAEVDMPFKETMFIVEGQEIDLLRITSLEAVVRTIRLE